MAPVTRVPSVRSMAQQSVPSSISGRPRRVGVVVVGAGVVGASVARDLARRGTEVVVVDGAPGIGGGCSYANAAILAPGHVTPLATPALLREAPVQMLRRPAAVALRPARGLAPWLGRLAASAAPHRSGPGGHLLRALAHESTTLHRELADRGLSPTLRRTGAVDVYLREARGAALSPEQLRALEPMLGEVAGGSHDEDEWTVESRSYVSATLEDAVAHGAELHFGTDVRALVPHADGGHHVVTDRTTVHAEHVVLAAGVQSSVLAAQVGVELPLRGGRGYVVDVAATESDLRMPVRIKEHRVVVTPLEDRVRVCGSIEFGDESRPADLRRADALLEVATRVLPDLAGREVLDRWAGERPCTPDGMPLVGTSRVAPGLAVATGHGMWGMILAPVTARLITEALLDGTALPTEEWLHPDRFTRGSHRRSFPGGARAGLARRGRVDGGVRAAS